MEFDSTDPYFSVTWLLGLQSSQQHQHQRIVNQYRTEDPDFCASRLLGLPQCQSCRPLLNKPPAWVKQYQTEEPGFRVSRILGLVPSIKPRIIRQKQKRAQRKQLSMSKVVDIPDPQDGEQEAEQKQEGSPPEEDGWGLNILFNENDEEAEEESSDGESEDTSDEESEDESQEKPKESEDSTESKESKESKETQASTENAEDPILAHSEFLELCERMEQLLDEIQSEESKDDSDTESMDGLSPEECEDESPSRLEWLRQKNVERAENKYLDRLMSLPGLEETKAFFLHAKAKYQAASRRDTNLKKENFDVVFMGNEGTGKTAMAGLYAKFLKSLGVVKQTSNVDVINRFSGYGMSKTSTLSTMTSTSQNNDNNGCIAIIDHAHLLDNDSCNLWNFYVRSQELPGKIVIIVAGNGPWGLSDLMSYSAEVSNHFPVLKLPNYTPEQLQEVFHGMMRRYFNKRMGVEGGYDGLYVKILIKRITRGMNEKTFGNIWPVRNAFLEACRRQVERFRQARRDGNYLEDYHMTKEDLLGNKPSLSPDKSPAWKELQGLVGLDEVKESILSVVGQVNQNWIRQMRGQEPLQITPNRVFLGSPGTGKTTVAKLYGRILADFGVLSKGKVIVKNPSDLIDQYVGGSENNTKDALREAMGSILIIDDAHMLDPGSKSGGSDADADFRCAVLDTLVAEVSGSPGEDRCVILCGYPDQMKQMFANGNPGLSRRFPMESAFVFNDFGEEDLGKILDMKLEKEKLVATNKAREVAMEVLKRAMARPNFSNGGEVDNLLSKAISSRVRRISKEMSTTVNGEEKEEDVDLDAYHIEPQDFDPDHDRHTRAVANTRALFSDFVGYEDIISKFESYQYMVQGMRLHNLDPRPYVPFTFVFKGPPGTGKTTTARKLGHIFYDMGFLSAPEVVDVSASQLVGEYLGQTGPKTRRLLESALGKVLFIDEAYRLTGPRGSFADEAVCELVDAMTRPQFARKLVIVLAGYDEDMDRLMRSNQGMRSRFATEFVFRPLRADQCIEQLRRVVARVGITIQATRDMDSSSRTALTALLHRLAADKSWASGRSVETLGERLIAHIFKQCALNGYAGKDLSVSGKELVTILAQADVGGSAAAKKWGTSGPMGARQVMTLKDLEGYE